MNQTFRIFETAEHGLSLRVLDTEIGDKLEDYLNEECFVLYKTKMDENGMEFLFGLLGDRTKLENIIEDFCRTRGVT